LKTIGEFKNEIKTDSIGLYGGSHGGTIGALLCGNKKYNCLFSALAMRNPMMDFYSNMVFSDITDWHVAEVLNKPMTYEFSEEDILKMY